MSLKTITLLKRNGEKLRFMHELKDVQFAEPESESILRKKTHMYVSGVALSVITIIMLLYGFIKVQKDLSTVIILYELQNSSLHVSNSNSKKEIVELELEFQENVQKPLFIKLEISGIRTHASRTQYIPVTLNQFIGHKGNLKRINKFNTDFVFIKNDMRAIPIKLYNTIYPNSNVSFIYNFEANGEIFKSFIWKLYYLATDITPMIKLRSGMLNITLISTIVLSIQFYYCKKSFSSSMAYFVGLVAILASNPLITRPTYNDIIDIYWRISYSFFRAYFLSVVPAIGLSFFPFFEYLPVICLMLFLFFFIVMFLLLCPIFTVHHQPFFINSGFSNYPYPYVITFATPLIIFLSFFGILLLFIAIYFVDGTEKYKLLITAIVQIYAAYTTLTTTFQVPFLPQIAKLESQQGIFYDAFVQVICSLIFGLLLTNVQIKIED